MYKFISFLAACFFALSCTAQNRGPLNGSGVLKTQTFAFQNFDKIDVEGFGGFLDVEVGKPYGISVTIDDNLEPLLNVVERNGLLSLSLKGNRNNRLYLEDNQIKVRITLPSLTAVQHRSNSTMNISGVKAETFNLISKENGGVTVTGTANTLNIKCGGNSQVRVEEFKATKVNTKRRDNGNIYMDAKTQEVAHIQETKRVDVTLINEGSATKSYTVCFPVKGSYGIDIKPGEVLKENFPVGTKLFETRFDRLMGNEACKVIQADQQTFRIK